MENFSFQPAAFSKIFLHSLKHLNNDTYGVLLGNVNNGKYTLTDVVPIAHERLFAPQMEVSFKMIELCKSDKENVIIGFYENLIISYINDQKFSNTVNFISETIHNKSFKNPILITINNKEGTVNLQDESSSLRTKEEPEIRVFKYNGSNFDCLGEYKISEQEKANMKTLLSEKKQEDIVDFDDHFMDCSLDWRNTFVNK